MRKTIFTGLVIVGLIGPASASASTTKPFDGAFTAVTTPIATQPGCELSWISTQQGEASHLGSFTGEAIGCGFNSMISAETPLPVEGGPPYFVADYTLEGTWTAANGDQIRYSVRGLFVQSTQNGASATSVTQDLLGGSGRFEDATGQVTADDIGKREIEFSGWIAYDASDSSD